MSACDRELNVHFYSPALVKYHATDTWHDTTHSHIIQTPGRPVLALSAKRAAACTILTTLVCRGQWSNLWSPVTPSGYSTDWAIGAGLFVSVKFDQQHTRTRKGNSRFCGYWIFNPYLTRGTVHPYHLDEFITYFRGVWCTFFIFITWTSPLPILGVSGVLSSFLFCFE